MSIKYGEIVSKKDGDEKIECYCCGSHYDALFSKITHYEEDKNFIYLCPLCLNYSNNHLNNAMHVFFGDLKKYFHFD